MTHSTRKTTITADEMRARGYRQGLATGRVAPGEGPRSSQPFAQRLKLAKEWHAGYWAGMAAAAAEGSEHAAQWLRVSAAFDKLCDAVRREDAAEERGAA